MHAPSPKLSPSLALALLLALAAPALADTPPPATRPAALDLVAVQGLLAVQKLDGWLLYDNRGQNPIAGAIVSTPAPPSRRWFYLVRSEGPPVAVIHKIDAALFESLPGTKITYTGHRDLERALGELLKGMRRVAMEYSPRAALPELSRVDAGTLELVRRRGLTIVSSAELVQIASAVWGTEGRRAHYVTAHHLDKLREAALVLIAERLRSNTPVTELEVQSFLARGYEARGLVGPPPVVAAGPHTASPAYVPTPATSRTIAKGDLIVLGLRARLASAPRPVHAEVTWMAYAGATVPEKHAELFAVVARARDAAVALIKERTERRRALRGFEVDRKARDVIDQAGHGARFIHRTGHSLDAADVSASVTLDDLETRDERVLAIGAGFIIAPGIYVDGEVGVRAAASVHITRGGVELTTPVQAEITALLAR